MVSIKRCGPKELANKLKGKEHVICFGISKKVIDYSKRYGREWIKSVECFVDSKYDEYGHSVRYFDIEYPIYSPKWLETVKNSVIIITTAFASGMEILGSLGKMNIDVSVDCYSLWRISCEEEYDNDVMERYLSENSYPYINKTIHCCWLSGEKKPKEYQECIDSWKKYCPDYKIIEWNSSNYDLEKNKYMKQAYEQRKWAFASDYIRLDVVHKYGGIYLDMDVELVRSLESLRRLRVFFSIDSLGWVDLGSGFGAEKNNKVIKKLLEVYDDLEFHKEILSNGTEGYLPQPNRLLPVFQSIGYVFGTDTQFVSNSMFLSPSYIKVIEDMTHVRRNLSGKEYAIHWHNGAWKDVEWREKRQLKNECLAKCIEEYDEKVSTSMWVSNKND